MGIIRTFSTVAVLACALVVCAPGLAKTPLEVCYDQAGNQGRLALSPCLEAMLKEAETEMASVLAARRKAAHELAQATGRRISLKSLEKAQRQFASYRKAQCQYVMDAMDAGTGAGDAHRDCMVRLTRQRVEELRAQP